MASRKAVWTGRVLSGLAVLFLLFDAGVKVLEHPMAVQGTAELGYPQAVIFGLGILQVERIAQSFERDVVRALEVAHRLAQLLGAGGDQ